MFASLTDDNIFQSLNCKAKHTVDNFRDLTGASKVIEFITNYV